MVQFLTSLVCCPKGRLGRAETVLCHGRCLAPGRLHQRPRAFAAPSAVGAVKGMGEPVGNYSLIPITGCSRHSLSVSGQLGLNKVMVTSATDQRSLPSDWGR